MFIRRLPTFEHHTPATVAAALDLLSRLGSHGRLLAGGTDIFPAMKRREQTPAHLISLKEIDGLKGISADDQEIHIGALTTLGEIERSELIRQHLPILRNAVQVMASPQIRTLATIGGNICSAVPSLTLLGADGERTVPIEDFFTGPKESILRADEILTGIIIPRPPAHSGGVYIKLMRRNAMELALVGVAAQLHLDASLKICENVRIALGSVAPTPILAPEAAGMLVGREIDETLAAEAGKAAAKICRPRSNSIRASVEYRRSMVEVLTKRAILEALQSVSR
jgi:CO/xanthine dehydrogenase FAD-binding subunit